MFLRLSIIVLYFGCVFMKAQTKEIGVFLGYSNVISDIGNNHPISPLEEGATVFDPAVGVFYKQVLNPRMLVKFGFMYGFMRVEDSNSPRLDRQARNNSFDSDLYEGTITFEYNFFDIYNGYYKSTPYIFAGLGAFAHRNSDTFIDFNLPVDGFGNSVPPTSGEDYRTTITTKRFYAANLVLPFGFGYKFRIKDKFMLGLEFGARATWYDNLDGSNPKSFAYEIDPLLVSDPFFGPEISENIINRINDFKSGNSTNFDWYTYTGVTFSYLFGEPPCYCK